MGLVSRREVLATSCAALASTGIAGCSRLDPGPAKTGYLQLKTVTLRWGHDGRTYEDQPLRVLFGGDGERIDARYDPDFLGDAVSAPDDIIVGENLHRELGGRFEVNYLLGFCGEDFTNDDERIGCRNTRTSRDDFNRVQFGDRAEVGLSDERFEVQSVSEDEVPTDGAAVTTFDFADLHEDHGIDPNRW
jgi:hypothetical protein